MTNRMEIHGWLGSDPAVKTREDGQQFVVFSVNDTKGHRGNDGQFVKTKQQWVSCVIGQEDMDRYRGQLWKGREVTVYGNGYVNPYMTKEGAAAADLQVSVWAIQYHRERQQGGQGGGYGGNPGGGNQSSGQGFQGGQNPNQQGGDSWDSQQAQGAQWGQNPNQAAQGGGQQSGGWGNPTGEEPPF
ncbi:single-stranded DNA-binding protein [Brevibacterium moorei]|uniref:single-stranded DNA-binding protein n=1 Tax=Brevibacterium moorei TaxID=2968457 RepID=UPI00211C5EBC|nr:single-stranded DNA-binding protein [Brevibacterium sp. 68QC2CO]MCQ9384385.1 single-stranded DNA-binding protein [Brevibacterium sp. 68QC2CO]